MDEKIETKMSPAEKRSADMIERVKKNCEILGVPVLEEYYENASKRAVLARNVKKLQEKENPTPAPSPKKEVPPVPVKKLVLDRNSYVIEDSELKVSIIMSEGLKFEDNGKERQIPEITITFKREYDFGENGVNDIARAMRQGMRPITKSVGSILIDFIEKKTIYPDSFEKAIEHLSINFNKRLVKNFGFDVDFSELKHSRLSTIFDRAYSGTRFLTTVAEIK